MVGNKVLCCLGANLFSGAVQDQRNLCWTCQGATCVFLVLGIWGDFKYFVNVLIHGFGSGSKMIDAEGFSLGCCVGDYWSSFTLGFCKTGSTLRASTGMLGIFWSWRFSFWVYGSSGGKGIICKHGWDVIMWKVWEIWLITFFVASPYDKKESFLEGFFIIEIMYPMSCCKSSFLVVFGKANIFGIYWSASVIFTMPVAGM